MPFKDKEKQREANRKSYHKHKDDRHKYSADYHQTHKEARHVVGQAYYAKNRERILIRTKEYAFKKKYNLTLEQFEALWESQAGLCLICHTFLIRGDNRGSNSGNFHIDHDHKTNKVRGILCVAHNMGLGYFQDSPKLLRQAADYLERHG